MVAAFVLVLARKVTAFAARKEPVCSAGDFPEHARRLLSKLNISAEPCHDFHAYIGGGADDDAASTTDALDCFNGSKVLHALLRPGLEGNYTPRTTLEAPIALDRCADRSGASEAIEDIAHAVNGRPWAPLVSVFLIIIVTASRGHAPPRERQKKKMMSSLVLVTALALPFAEAFAGTVNPNYYEIVSLNDFCDNKENKKDLRNTTQSKSAAIVTATQFRDMRGSIKDGCSIDLSTKGTAGLIVSLVEMNLRSGVLNRSCIDYVNIVTKFHIPSDKDERCGRVRADEYRYFATSQSLQLRLHSRTPLSTFFDGYTLAVVVTSFTEASSRDGGCAPHEFQCVAGGRCIYKHYQCDNINNCGDNSDEEQLGNSMCREHRGRFRNALVVPPLFPVL
ncbi:hypothetical protein HPB49_013856 [Dermacentor silvarum]|uniref:Uncharacterized protein n=1 Tax=Dermacentor silvarum TaxID=543639 RepID=A0ACB8D5T1_DERSI|nr:hypothetical protein HPB49_013856 [Dermacentor silvarum]